MHKHTYSQLRKHTGVNLCDYSGHEQYFRTPEAAEYLRISLSRLNKLRCYGGGPVYHVAGRTIIYSRADLDAWLAKHRRTSTSGAGR